MMTTPERCAHTAELAMKVAMQFDPAGWSLDDDDGLHVCDMLANLMHYCTVHDIDFDKQLARAQGHFQYETSHPEEE